MKAPSILLKKKVIDKREPRENIKANHREPIHQEDLFYERKSTEHTHGNGRAIGRSFGGASPDDSAQAGSMAIWPAASEQYASF
jgi:hypothetical protein